MTCTCNLFYWFSDWFSDTCIMNLVFFITIAMPIIKCKSITTKSPYTLTYTLPKTPIACSPWKQNWGPKRKGNDRLPAIPFSGAKILVTGSRLRHIEISPRWSPCNSRWHPPDSPWSYIARKVKQSGIQWNGPWKRNDALEMAGFFMKDLGEMWKMDSYTCTCQCAHLLYVYVYIWTGIIQYSCLGFDVDLFQQTWKIIPKVYFGCWSFSRIVWDMSVT